MSIKILVHYSTTFGILIRWELIFNYYITARGVSGVSGVEKKWAPHGELRPVGLGWSVSWAKFEWARPVKTYSINWI